MYYKYIHELDLKVDISSSNLKKKNRTHTSAISFKNAFNPLKSLGNFWAWDNKTGITLVIYVGWLYLEWIFLGSYLNTLEGVNNFLIVGRIKDFSCQNIYRISQTYVFKFENLRLRLVFEGRLNGYIFWCLRNSIGYSQYNSI